MLSTKLSDHINSSLHGQTSIDVQQSGFDLRGVFVLAGNLFGQYGVMTYIAMQSLRITNPNMKVTLLCDTRVADDISRSRHGLMFEADEIIAVEAPYSTDTENSRYLKTKMRESVKGPFVFLDSDVLVRGKLCRLIEYDGYVAGARNHSLSSYDAQIWNDDREILNKMGWDVSGLPYINTGVLYFADTQHSYEFSNEWHWRWIKSNNDCRKHQDQPAFNRVLRDHRLGFILLPDKYNAQLKMNTECVKDALIWHYYGSQQAMATTGFEHLVQRIIQNNELVDRNVVLDLVTTEHPWTCKTFLDRWLVNRSIARGRMKISEEAWLARNFTHYLLKFLWYQLRLTHRLNRPTA